MKGILLFVIAVIIIVAMMTVIKRRRKNCRLKVSETVPSWTCDQLDSAFLALSRRALAYAVYEKLLTVVVSEQRKASLLKKYGEVLVVPSLRSESMFRMHPENMLDCEVIDKIGVWIRMHGGVPHGEFLRDARTMGEIMVAEASDQANQIVEEAVKDS